MPPPVVDPISNERGSLVADQEAAIGLSMTPTAPSFRDHPNNIDTPTGLQEHAQAVYRLFESCTQSGRIVHENSKTWQGRIRHSEST